MPSINHLTVGSGKYWVVSQYYSIHFEGNTYKLVGGVLGSAEKAGAPKEIQSAEEGESPLKSKTKKIYGSGLLNLSLQAILH